MSVALPAELLIDGVGNNMKMFKIAALVSASILAAPAAMAASVLIDDFSVFQEAADQATAQTGSPTLVVDASLFGGSRFFEVTNTTPGGGGSGGTILTSTGNNQAFQQTPENTLKYANDPGQTGIATVIYDGRNALNVGATFAPFDLTDGGTNTKFFFDLVEDTPNFAGATFTTTVTDTNGSATFVELLDNNFSEFTEFSSFAGINFAEVTSLAFTFNTNALAGFDANLASISAVPLPASILLLLGGLGGLAGVSTVSKRRRKA